MGRRLGNYELVREIGRGAMGVVYEARQLSLDRRVALKILHPAYAADDRRVARFRREAELAASLRHPAIVPVHEFGDDDGTLFYSMDLIDGAPLDRVVRFLHEHPTEKLEDRPITTVLEVASRAGPPTDDQAPTMEAPKAAAPEPQAPIKLPADEGYVRSVVNLVAEVAEALHVAHSEKNIVHRDIKPSNLMLDRYGRIHVLDFGIALDRDFMTLTRLDEAVGTLPYMSPEQLVGKRLADLDARSDIYSLGATLYELLTFEPPFRGRTQAELERRIKWELPRPLREKRRGVSRDLEIIVLKTLRKNPDDRYSNAMELAQDLRRFLRHEAPLAAPGGRVERISLWYRRNAVAVTIAATVLVVGGTAGAAFTLKSMRKARANAAEATEKLERIDNMVGAGPDGWQPGEVIDLATRVIALVPADSELAARARRFKELATSRDREIQIDRLERSVQEAMTQVYFLHLAHRRFAYEPEEHLPWHREELRETLERAIRDTELLSTRDATRASFEPHFLRALVRLESKRREDAPEVLADLQTAESILAAGGKRAPAPLLLARAQVHDLLADNARAQEARKAAKEESEQTTLDYTLAGYNALVGIYDTDVLRARGAANDVDLAIDFFDDALRKDVNFPPAVCGHGIACWLKARSERAAVALRRKRGENASDGYWNHLLDLAYRDLSRYSGLNTKTWYPIAMLAAISYYRDTYDGNLAAMIEIQWAIDVAERQRTKTASLFHLAGSIFLDSSSAPPGETREMKADRYRNARMGFDAGRKLDPGHPGCFLGLAYLALAENLSLETYRELEMQFRQFVDSAEQGERLGRFLEGNLRLNRGSREEPSHLAMLALYQRATSEDSKARESVEEAARILEDHVREYEEVIREAASSPPGPDPLLEQRRIRTNEENKSKTEELLSIYRDLLGAWLPAGSARSGRK